MGKSESGSGRGWNRDKSGSRNSVWVAWSVFYGDVFGRFDGLCWCGWELEIFVLLFVLCCVRLSDFVVFSTFYNISFLLLSFFKLPHLPFKSCAVKFKEYIYIYTYTDIYISLKQYFLFMKQYLSVKTITRLYHGFMWSSYKLILGAVKCKVSQ